MDADGATNTLIMQGGIGRSERTWGQLWQVPMFLLGLAAFLAVAATKPYRADVREGPFDVESRLLRQALADQQDPNAVIAAGERILALATYYPRREGEAQFLLGTAYYRLAESAPTDAAAQGKALTHLERALVLGVPNADVPALHFRLGATLYHRGENLPRAVALMAQSIDQTSEDLRRAYPLLVEAYLKLPTPDVDAALTVTYKLLQAIGEPEEVDQIRYLRSELFLRKQQRLDALNELDRIRDHGPLHFKSRLLQAQVCEEEGLWNRAAACWKELLQADSEVPGGKARVLLAYGHCLASADPPDHAAATNAWQAALALGGEPGMAAGLRLGELLLFLPPGAPTQGLATLAESVKSLRSPAEYQNPYLEVAKARELFERVCRHFLDARDFDRALHAAELYKKVAASGAGELFWAQATEAQAQTWMAATSSGTGTTEQAEKLRGHFHRAAVAYEQASLSLPEDARIEPTWRSAQCYLAAKDLARGAVALERFVTRAKDEPRLAQGWYALAETQQVQGHKDRAREAYHKCMEFPETPYAYRARYQLALEAIERKDFEHAKDILQQNLFPARPNMDRDAHEKSIYKMAGLMLQMKAHDKAAWFLKEASRQYPNNANALYARDHLAECYRLLAEQAQQKLKDFEALKSEQLSPERRASMEELKAHQREVRRQWLEQAISVYQGLIEELRPKAVQKPLAKDEALVLRKALFGSADRQFDLDDFAEAIRRYERLQQEYSKQVEGLIACNKIWQCVSVMVETPEQRRLARESIITALKTARADLETMPAESDAFRGAGVWTKANWISWLDFVDAQLRPPVPATTRPNPLLD